MFDPVGCMCCSPMGIIIVILVRDFGKAKSTEYVKQLVRRIVVFVPVFVVARRGNLSWNVDMIEGLVEDGTSIL